MSLEWIPDNPVTPLSPVAIDTGARAARDEAVAAAATLTTLVIADTLPDRAGAFLWLDTSRTDVTLWLEDGA